MRIDVWMSEEEVLELIQELAPMRIHLTSEAENGRWVDLHEPEKMELVEAEGLRVVTTGEFRFSPMNIPITIDIKRVQLLVEPRIDVVKDENKSSAALVFDIQVEQGDLQHIPKLVEERVLELVNRGLLPEKIKTYWQFPKTLTKAFPLPKKLEPLDRFLFESGEASARVQADGLFLSVVVGTDLLRSAARPE
jgi:hypothetical protein